MSNTGIYVITSPTNKVYVGQSTNLKDRQRVYRDAHCKGQPKLYSSLKKYGWTAHKFEVILPLKEDINQGQLNYWEQFFMDYYRQNGFELMNIREGGHNGKMSAETIEKIKLARIGEKRKPCSEETKRKIGNANRGRSYHPNPPLTDKQKKLMLEGFRKFVRTEEYRINQHIVKSGEKSPKAKFTNQQVRIIMHALKFGAKRRDLSRIFNTNYETIRCMEIGKSWCYVTGIYHPSRKVILK